MVNFADLTSRTVTLERIASEPAPFEAGAVTWAPIATVRAGVFAVSDREKMQAAELSATISHRITILRTPTVAALTPKDRLTLDGVVHDITGVKEIDRRRFLEITTSARAD